MIVSHLCIKYCSVLNLTFFFSVIKKERKLTKIHKCYKIYRFKFHSFISYINEINNLFFPEKIMGTLTFNCMYINRSSRSYTLDRVSLEKRLRLRRFRRNLIISVSTIAIIYCVTFYWEIANPFLYNWKIIQLKSIYSRL